MRVRTIIESPYAGAIALHVAYLDLCILDSLQRGEAPFASHRFYTLVLDDTNELQRREAMECGFEWMRVAGRVAVYEDLGVTDGMRLGIAKAREYKLEIVFRKLNDGLGILVPRRVGDL